MFDHATVERYETGWLAVAVVMVLLLFTTVLASLTSGAAQHLGVHGDHTPTRVDIHNLAATPFGQPGVREDEHGDLHAYVVAKAFTFEPRELRVPAGREVTLHFTSVDVTHGVMVAGTNLNAQLLPGEVATIRHTFSRPGRFLVSCNEYCGAAHHAMTTWLVVEARP